MSSEQISKSTVNYVSYLHNEAEKSIGLGFQKVGVGI